MVGGLYFQGSAGSGNEMYLGSGCRRRHAGLTHVSTPPPPTPPCTGSFDLALVGLTGAADNVYAQCYSQTSIILGTDCSVTVLPTANTGVYIANLWAADGMLPYNSYSAW